MLRKCTYLLKCHSKNTITTILYHDDIYPFTPAIFITPVLGNFHFLEHSMAKLLAKSGFSVFITSFMPTIPLKQQFEDLAIHDEAYLLSIEGTTELINLAKSLPFIDDSKLGLFGMSLGGIFTALNLRLHDCFKASVIIAGAGGNGKILTQSKSPLIAYMRRSRMKKHGLKSLEEYELLINKHVQWDALKIETPVDRETIFMLISTNDKHVPTEAQMLTWESFNRPEAMFIDRSHFQLISLVPLFYFHKIMEFFVRKLQV